MNGAPAPFRALRPFPFVRQKILQRSQQKRPKSSTFLLRSPERFLFQQLGKEGLRQILSVFRAATLSAHVSIKRVPICAAQLLQRLLCPRRGIVTGGKD